MRSSRALEPFEPFVGACASPSLETLTSSSPLKYASTRASHAVCGESGSADADSARGSEAEAGSCCTSRWRVADVERRRYLRTKPCVQPQQGRGGGSAARVLGRSGAAARGAPPFPSLLLPLPVSLLYIPPSHLLGWGVGVRRVPESLGVGARRSRCVCAAAAGATRRDPPGLHGPRRLAGVPMPRGGFCFSG
jgi:hypothetical protein